MTVEKSAGREEADGSGQPLPFIHEKDPESYLLAALMENLPDHIYFKDLSSRFIRNNLAHARSMGLNSPAEMTGKSDFDFFQEDVARTQYNDEQEIIRTGNTVNKEEKTIRSDGSVNWYYTTKMPLKDHLGNIIGTFGISRDITQNKLVGQQLTQLSRAVEQSPVSIVITSLTGDIVYANPKACETTGYTLQELMGQNPRVLKSGETDAADYSFLWNTITSGKDWKGIFHNKRKNEELYWEAATIGPIRNSEGEITHFLAVKEDITEQKKAEEEIRRQNSDLTRLNAEKDKFFSIIAHDLRSPFNSFLNLSKIIAEEVQDMSIAEIRQLANSMSKSATSLFELLENLLEWSMLQRGITQVQPENIDLKSKLDRLVPVFGEWARTKEITLQVYVEADLEIYADEAMIESSLRNLLSNAIKFTPTGGTVKISAVKCPEKSCVLITVSDTGIGMSPEFQEKLFRIDQNVSRKGTDGEASSGLGLLLCKDFIEKNGGRIWVESEPDKGSAFNFTVPLTTSPIPQ